MIIKNMFRRYERWNPVHPTIGSFWGVGVGIGCGIGWGPGFGHEVVGYVGAGCGAGFNVGITFLGVGIGFPSNYLLTGPYNAFLAARKGSLGIIEDGWGNSRSDTSFAQQGLGASFSGLKVRDLADVRSTLASHTKSMTDCLHRVSGGFFPLNRASRCAGRENSRRQEGNGCYRTVDESKTRSWETVAGKD